MSSLRAFVAGKLPALTEAVVEGIRLPVGSLLQPREPGQIRRAISPNVPRAWISKDLAPNVAELVTRLAEVFPRTGLWPLALESLRHADERPWRAGEVGPEQGSNPSVYDVPATLSDWWASSVPSEAEMLDVITPFERAFPGLAPAPEPSVNRVPIHDAVAGRTARLGLVPVTRPADVPAALGWAGPVNHHEDTGPLSAVLRSWEERFDAFVVSVGFDTLALAVGRTPSTRDAARLLAAEHFAVCPDLIYQGCGSIEVLAESLLHDNVWEFWWD